MGEGGWELLFILDRHHSGASTAKHAEEEQHAGSPQLLELEAVFVCGTERDVIVLDDASVRVIAGWPGSVQGIQLGNAGICPERCTVTLARDHDVAWPLVSQDRRFRQQNRIALPDLRSQQCNPFSSAL